MKLRSRKFSPLVLALILYAALPVLAGRDYLFRICPDDFVVFNPEKEKIWIPVGCEVVDCCPGCPGPPIDWHIFVEGDPLESVSLTFENLPPETIGRLGIKGEARWDGNTLRVGKGETVITGFAPDAKAAPPVAIPRITANRDAIKRIQDAAAADFNQSQGSANEMKAQRGAAEQPAVVDKGGEARSEAARKDTPRAEFRIEQRIGDVIVNETKIAYYFRWCPPPPPLTDRIRLVNNTTNDSAVVLLDARNGSGVCVDDQIWRGTGTINVGSILSNGSCNSEIAVFSDDNAMAMLTPVNTWTDPLGNLVTANLAALVQAPVDFWVMRGTFANTSARVTSDMARANQLYNTMNCGIGLQTGTVTDSTADPDTAGLLNANCGSAASLRSNIGFTNGRLNVYYLNDPGARGWWCGNNTIIIGSGADNESLTHELGHAFSLGHTNNVDFNGDGIPDFPGTNIMITGGTGRTTFSEGQCFRCNMNTASTLNSNGNRTGPTRSCADSAISVTCPWLALDATPN